MKIAYLTCAFNNHLHFKIRSKLFVPENLSFSEYLRCLNFPLWTFWPAKTKQVKESDLFWDKAPTRSGRFKHLKFSENDKFSGTNSVDSILIRITNLLLLIWWYLRVEWLVLFVEHTIGRWLLNNSYISLVAHAATRADKEGKAKAAEEETKSGS